MPIQTATYKKRLRTLQKLLVEQKLEMILIFVSKQEPGFGMMFNGLEPALYHYCYIRYNARKKLESGLFVPYFLVEAMGLKKAEVKVFDDAKMAEEMAIFLGKNKRIGIVGPAPAGHFEKSKSKLIFLDEKLMSLMSQKSADECKKIAACSVVVAKALNENQAVAGRGFKPMLAEIEQRMLKSGAALAFPAFILRMAKNKGNNPLEKGGKVRKKDLLFINAGLYKNGFFADCARMYIVGDKQAERDYDLLRKTQRKVVEMLKPGMLLCTIPDLYEKALKKSGLKFLEINKEHLGQSIGFGIIELPTISQNYFRKEKFVENMVITLVQEVEMPYGTLKLQDTIQIKKSGGIILTV